MKQSSIVIVGGGYAGVLAALRASRKLRGLASVTLLSDDTHLVERIRWHEHAASETPIRRALAHLLRGTGVALIKGRVRAIDRDAQCVRTDEGTIAYDRLLLAVGSGATWDEHVARHALSIEDPSLPHRVKADERARIVIAGGGLVGIELAAELAERRLTQRISLITQTLGEELGKKGRTHVRAALARLGVDVREGCQIAGVEEGRLLLSNGSVPFDLCVWTMGMTANPLAREAGLSVNSRGQALVSRSLKSIDDPSIYVLGDAATLAEPFDDGMPMGCKSAMPSGAHAADNLALELSSGVYLPDGTTGQAALSADLAPFSWRHPGTCVSLGRRDGVVQMSASDHAMTLTGRPAAMVKELICRLTIFSLRLERLGVGYQWLRDQRRKTGSSLILGARG